MSKSRLTPVQKRALKNSHRVESCNSAFLVPCGGTGRNTFKALERKGLARHGYGDRFWLTKAGEDTLLEILAEEWKS